MSGAGTAHEERCEPLLYPLRVLGMWGGLTLVSISPRDPMGRARGVLQSQYCAFYHGQEAPDFWTLEAGNLMDRIVVVRVLVPADCHLNDARFRWAMMRTPQNPLQVSTWNICSARQA
nr:hypothetical protein CFP56_28738 [Quercus suber]